MDSGNMTVTAGNAISNTHRSDAQWFEFFHGQ